MRDDKEASCSLVGVVELTISLVPEAGEDFQVMAATVQANPAVVLIDSGCYLIGTKEVFVDLQPSGDVKHMRSFNGALQDVQGRGTVAPQGEAGRQVLIPDVLYVPGVRANLLSADVLSWASYTGRVLCTDVHPCSAKSTTPTTEVVALRAIISVTKLTPDRLHARLAHVGMNTIRSSAKHEVATGLDLKSALGADLPYVSCVDGKLAWHTFPDQGSDADDVLAVVHVDLCGPFRVAAKDGSLYFLLLKDRKTRYVWVRPTKKSVLMLRSDRGGEFLGKQFTDFVNGKGIIHDLTCPYTPQQNGMAEHEMRTVVDSVRTILLHKGVQHYWWHLALRQAVWVRNCLERLTLQPGTTPYQLLTGKKPDLSLAWGWELLDIADNRVVTTSDVVFYENMSLEVWKSEHGPTSGQTLTTPPTDTSTATLPLLAKVGEPAAEEVKDVPFPSPSPAPCAPPLVADLRGLTSQVDVGVKSTLIGEEQAKEVQPTLEKPTKKAPAGQQPIGEQAAVKPTTKQSATTQRSRPQGRSRQGSWQRCSRTMRAVKLVTMEGTPRNPPTVTWWRSSVDHGSQAEFGGRPTSTYRLPSPRRTTRSTTTYSTTTPRRMKSWPKLDPDMHADPEHRWEILMMMVKEALASWKGKAVKAAMEEEIRILIGMGTWELVERPLGVNIMKNRWVLTTKYHIDDTVEREKARLVVKGFTQVYGADYDETYAPVSSYITLRIFLSIVIVLDLNLMQVDMKNAFLQSKLDQVLYIYQPDYFNDGTGRVCRLLKSLYGLKQSPLLWYRALDGVLLGAGWKKSQVDTALYFKVGDDKEISPVQKYLGLEIVHDSSVRKMWLHQQVYADKLRRRFLNKEQNERTLKTPVSVDAYATLTFDDEEAQERQEEEYRQKVGSLQFAATTTRPDIAFVCSKLGSGLTVRSDQHWLEVDHCLAYLANTHDTALKFGGGAESLKLVGYVDADDACDKQNRTSTGGYVFVFGGAAVSWSSQRIKCVTLSLTESEYVAATEAGKEGRRLCFLLAEFWQLDARTLTVLRVDNKSAITVTEGMGLTGNLKHMGRQQAWLQHMVKRGKFSLRYIPTAEQPADFLTKALHYPAFNWCSVAIGQVRLVDVGDGDNDVQK
ncbi:unnamed protein product [Closterium sp. NIES-54]